MSQDTCCYTFDDTVSMDEVEESLFHSALAAESLHGRARLRLEASFLLDPQKRTCEVDTSTEVGQTIVCIFTGFLTRLFGEDVFKVERMENIITSTR